MSQLWCDRHRVAYWSLFLAAGWCLLQAAGPLSAAPLAESVQPLIDRHELAGAVMLVADRDRVLAVETAGWADAPRQRPMRANTIFWIASQSKPITATALMLLVDEGRVALDDPVQKYLPEFAGQMVVAERDPQRVLLVPPVHSITVRNVLSHTSGLAFRSAIEVPTLDLWPLELRVRSYAMAPLEFQPDSQYLYSNAGINTAARIIEVVTGASFEEFLAERLLEPLGMRETTFWPRRGQLARLVSAHRPRSDGQGLETTPIEQLTYPLDDRARRTPMPAGGLFSTAADLARFYQMLLRGGELDGRRYLSEQAVHELTRRQTGPELRNSYGLGFAVGDGTFGHGGAYGTNTTAHTGPGLITVYLVQHAAFAGEGREGLERFQQAAIEAFGDR